MIRNVVFDLGNVLLKFEPKSLVAKYEKDVDKAEKVFRNIFKSDEWIELDRGTINEQEAVSRIIDRIPEHSQVVCQIFKEWVSILIPIDENVRLLEALAKMDMNLYILSNFHEEAFKTVSEKYEFFKNFDGGVVSYDVKMLKPDKEIYETLINKYHLLKEETLFIDDMKDNIIAAETIGINTIHYENNDKLVKCLKEYAIFQCNMV